MKNLNAPLFKLTTLCLCVIMMFTLSCKKADSVTTPTTPTTTPILISNVQPKNPLPGDVVTITGSGFGAVLTDVKVTIGTQTITVTTVTDGEIKFTLPTGITAGDIAVAIKGLLATNNDPQKATITPQVPVATTATIVSINPTSGKAGDIVSILGTGFSTIASENVVKFNGVAATVTGSVTSVLTVTVPAGVTTGVVTVSVKGAAVVTGPTFTVTTTTTGTGTAVTYIVTSGGTATFSKIATAPAEIGAMVVDKRNNVMYYSDYSIYTSNHPGNVYKLKLDGSAPTILSSDSKITQVVALALDATGNIYAVASLDQLGGVQANILKLDATTAAITTVASNVNFKASGSTVNIDSQGGVWLGYTSKYNATTNVFDNVPPFSYGSYHNATAQGDDIYVDDATHLANSNIAFYKYNLLTHAATVTDFTLQGLFKQDNSTIGTAGTDAVFAKYAVDGSDNFYAVFPYAGDASNGNQEIYSIRKTKNGSAGASTLVTKFYNKAFSVASPVFYNNPRLNVGILFQADASGNLYIKDNSTDIIKITY